jgi:hypothetical protein
VCVAQVDSDLRAHVIVACGTLKHYTRRMCQLLIAQNGGQLQQESYLVCASACRLLTTSIQQQIEQARAVSILPFV